MRSELVALIHGAEVSVALELGPDGRWKIAIDGRSLEVDAVEIRPGMWSLICDGRSLVVDIERGPRGVSLQFDGVEVPVQLIDARQHHMAQAMARTSRASVRGEVVRAPIAGKVVKVLCEVGQEVAAGQGVAVLEAMKMENEIKADRGGVVQTVHARPGQSVDTQEPLVTLT